MIDREDLRILAQSTGRLVREYVMAAIAAVQLRLDEIDARLKGIPAGAPGERGEKGDKGDPGRHGFDGEAGPQGIKGDPGPAGLQGERGLMGLTGAQGERGIDGRDGRDGLNGKDGANGADGKDAFDLRIFETIDLERSYSQGTFARYRNGLWRALAKTEPGPIEQSGWCVICEGLHEVRANFDATNPRRLILEQVLSSGASFRTICMMPMQIYRGLFQDGQTYELGDVVTYGGCAWHCQITTQARPGTTDTKLAWNLLVKEGRRGEAGKDGAPGKDGKDGRNGLDLAIPR